MEDAHLRMENFANSLADLRFREPPALSTVCSIVDGDNEAAIMGLLRTMYLANSGYGGHRVSRSRERSAAQELVFRSVQRLCHLSNTSIVPGVLLQPPGKASDLSIRACPTLFHSREPTSEAEHSASTHRADDEL